MRTILALLLLIISVPCSAATFNSVTGAGSCTDVEVGWGPDRATAFICIEQETYAVTVQYVNAQGATVTRNFRGIRRSHSGIKATPVMGGYNFVSRNPSEWIPDCNLTVGGQFIVQEPGERNARVGVITAATLQSTTVNVQAFHGLNGYKTIY